MMAMGAMVAIREAGCGVPDDIAVAGFDDIPVANLLNPPHDSLPSSRSGWAAAPPPKCSSSG